MLKTRFLKTKDAWSGSVYDDTDKVWVPVDGVIARSGNHWVLSPSTKREVFKTRRDAAISDFRAKMNLKVEVIELQLKIAYDANHERQGDLRLPLDVGYELYEILERMCGASSDRRAADAFAYSENGRHIWEYRFGGLLGFGGKFWNTARKWYVSAYPEDMTPEMRYRIARTNIELQMLYSKYHDRRPPVHG